MKYLPAEAAPDQRPLLEAIAAALGEPVDLLVADEPGERPWAVATQDRFVCLLTVDELEHRDPRRIAADLRRARTRGRL